MSSSNDDLPELQLEEVLDEEEPVTTAEPGEPAIEIDFADELNTAPPVARDIPPGAAIPPAPSSDAELELDVSFDEPEPSPTDGLEIDLDLDDSKTGGAPPAPTASPRPPAPTAAPRPPMPPVESATASPSVPVAAKKLEAKVDLDLDALLSDLDLGGSLGTAKQLTTPRPPPAEAQKPTRSPPAAELSVEPPLAADLDHPEEPPVAPPAGADDGSFAITGFDETETGPNLGSATVAGLSEIAAELERREESAAESSDPQPVADVATEINAAFDLADDLEPPLPEQSDTDEAPVDEANTTPPTPTGDHTDADLDFSAAAPPLPYSEAEPEPTPMAGIEEIAHSPETIAMLKQLAGAGADPQSARLALHQAIKGEPYDVRALPDARAMMLGLCRVLAATGYSVNEMVDAIIAALEE